MDLNVALSELRTELARGGVRAALAYLNSKTDHRFTSMYQFDEDVLRNLAFFDRENPDAEPPDDIPVWASYCVYVRDTRQPFRTADALADHRVTNHPKRLVVQAYCGVPLVNAEGRMFGTLCHFDLRPLPISDANVELMEAFALLLKQRDY